MNKELEVM